MNYYIYIYNNKMSIIKSTNYEYNFTSETNVIEPENWSIVKSNEVDDNSNPVSRYTLCIEHVMARAGCLYGLCGFEIQSSSDNISVEISEDKNNCTIITDKYEYKFKKTTSRDIPNNMNGIYRSWNFEPEFIRKLFNTEINSDKKYDFILDGNILNFYVDNIYSWSKIISLRYTKGIYFVLFDKVFTVEENGGGILNIFNLDGTLYKNILTSPDYIEYINIIENDEGIDKYLEINGFIWQPIYVRQYIDIDTLLSDKLRQKTFYEDDNQYIVHEFNDSDLEFDE